jgi:putative membrane protein
MNSKWAIATVLVLSAACKKDEPSSVTQITAAPAPTVEDTALMKPYTTPAVSAPLTNDDKDFITKAMQDGMLEVQVAEEAAQKASSSDVKSYADHLVNEHTKANDELKQLASQKGAMAPTTLDDSHKKTLDKLTKLNGMPFDRQFSDDMISDHEKDVKAFEKASKNLTDPDLRAYAQRTLPALQQHLQMAKDLKTKIKK